MGNRERLTIMLTGLMMLFCSMAPQAAIKELDHIVALVNDDIIAKSELDSQTRELLAQLEQKQTNLPPMRIIQQQVLERMITKRLQLQAARRLGLSVDDATVTKAIANIAQTNRISLLQLRETLEADGINFARFREQLREDILINR
ncbi:MAG: SurA N-terminal domain-containing protein, partial [Candidatus Thiodiazotropha sp.]